MGTGPKAQGAVMTGRGDHGSRSPDSRTTNNKELSHLRRLLERAAQETAVSLLFELHGAFALTHDSPSQSFLSSSPFSTHTNFARWLHSVPGAHGT